MLLFLLMVRFGLFKIRLLFQYSEVMMLVFWFGYSLMLLFLFIWVCRNLVWIFGCSQLKLVYSVKECGIILIMFCRCSMKGWIMIRKVMMVDIGLLGRLMNQVLLLVWWILLNVSGLFGLMVIFYMLSWFLVLMVGLI